MREVQIDAPIPGQSLTAPIGSRPWQQPPQYTTVEQALDYYLPKLTDKDFIPELLNIMEIGIPLTTIANSMQTAGVSEGKHTIDVGILITPVIVELLKNIGEANGIEYVTGIEGEKSDEFSSASLSAAKKRGDLTLEEPTLEEPTIPMSSEPIIEDNADEEEIMEEPKGLMARRSTVT